MHEARVRKRQPTQTLRILPALLRTHSSLSLSLTRCHYTTNYTSFCLTLCKCQMVIIVYRYCIYLMVIITLERFIYTTAHLTRNAGFVFLLIQRLLFFPFPPPLPEWLWLGTKVKQISRKHGWFLSDCSKLLSESLLWHQCDSAFISPQTLTAFELLSNSLWPCLIFSNIKHSWLAFSDS